MAKRPRLRCPRPSCPNARPCPTHDKRTNPTTSPNARFYTSRPWRNLAHHVLDEERICPGYPTGPCGAPTTVADHIQAIEDGGPRLDRNNISALCSSCHGRKSAFERDQRHTPR